VPPGSVWRGVEETILLSDVRRSPWTPAAGFKIGRAVCGVGAGAVQRIVSSVGGVVARGAGVMRLIGARVG
jgi:hypothetical protein